MIFVTHMETTPNPNALKYVLNETILADGICQYSTVEEADDDMGRAIFAAPGVVSLFYRDNYITVTKNNEVDWIDIETLVKDEINNRVEAIEFVLVISRPQSKLAIGRLRLENVVDDALQEITHNRVVVDFKILETRVGVQVHWSPQAQIPFLVTDQHEFRVVPADADRFIAE